MSAAAVRGAQGGPRRGVSAPGGSLDPIPSPYREDQTMQDTIDLCGARKPTSPRTAALRHEVAVLRRTCTRPQAGLGRSRGPRLADPAPASQAADAPARRALTAWACAARPWRSVAGAPSLQRDDQCDAADEPGQAVKPAANHISGPVHPQPDPRPRYRCGIDSRSRPDCTTTPRRVVPPGDDAGES